MRLPVRPVLLRTLAWAALLLAPAGSGLLAQDADAARKAQIAAARARWEAMTADQKEKVRARFQQWQQLPEDRRELLRRRLDELGGPQGAEFAHRRLNEIRRKSPEQLARIRAQAVAFRDLVNRGIEKLPPGMKARFDALPAGDQERVRTRLGRAILDLGRDQMLRTHATEEDRRALKEGTPVERRAALRNLYQRIDRDVLAPHLAELKALPEEERRARKARLLGEAFWNGVKERRIEIGDAFDHAVRERRVASEVRDRFVRVFGVPADQLGDPSVARSFLHAYFLVPPESRFEWQEKVKGEVRRIVDGTLPSERAAALRRLLEEHTVR